MTANTFDTLTAARELEAAGLDRRQAEAIAKTVRDGQGDLATKGDIEGLRWIVGIVAIISLATLAGVIAIATRIFGEFPAP